MADTYRTEDTFYKVTAYSFPYNAPTEIGQKESDYISWHKQFKNALDKQRSLGYKLLSHTMQADIVVENNLLEGDKSRWGVYISCVFEKM